MIFCRRQAQEANRLEYRDLGLVFAKPTGHPLQSNNLGAREFAKLVELAGVKANESLLESQLLGVGPGGRAVFEDRNPPDIGNQSAPGVGQLGAVR